MVNVYIFLFDAGISLHKKYAFLTFSNDLVTKFPGTKQHHLKYLLTGKFFFVINNF